MKKESLKYLFYPFLFLAVGGTLRWIYANELNLPLLIGSILVVSLLYILGLTRLWHRAGWDAAYQFGGQFVF